MKRYSLSLYQEWMKPLRLPSFLAAAGLAIVFIASQINVLPDDLLRSDSRNALLSIATLAAFLVWILVLFLPRMSFVQCLDDRMLLQIGMLRTSISYGLIRTSHSVQHAQIFPPDRQPASRRFLAERLASRQSILVELNAEPVAYSLLRTFSHPFLFVAEPVGFLFAVNNWMGLDRDIDQARSTWQMRRKDTPLPRRLEGFL
jgi:hypothetical protein